MDKTNVLELHFFKKKKKKTLKYKMLPSCGRGVVLSIYRRRKDASIILNVHIL